jgi:hypothetical protein
MSHRPARVPPREYIPRLPLGRSLDERSRQHNIRRQSKCCGSNLGIIWADVDSVNGIGPIRAAQVVLF